MFEKLVEQEGCTFITWRKVPCDDSILGQKAKDCMPSIYQAFVQGDTDLEQKLYVIRREFEKSCKETYVASLSSRTIVYKGMFLVSQLRKFYFDLQDENYKSALRSYTHVSLPIQHHHGKERIQTAILPTTVKSIPSVPASIRC